MQERHNNRKQYFRELAITSKKYYIPYIQPYKQIKAGVNVLEIGCGDGGNLLPFSEMGCHTVGVDIAESRIKDAKRFFKENNAKGEFIASDIFKVKNLYGFFDIVICHDVLEHIDNKKQFLIDLKKFLSKGGIIFMSFPAWQMPFGGHQQICTGWLASHLPFTHLLPKLLYAGLLRLCHEKQETINELLSIKHTQCSIESFRKIALGEYQIINQQFYFINPHYEIKFGIKPRKLSPIISSIPFIRNYFTTSFFCILKIQQEKKYCAEI